MKRTYIVITLYIIFLLLIFLIKPAMMFDESGNIKHFGYNDNDTSASLLNAEIILIFLALFSYFLVIALELLLY
jgi:hypothetical protein